MEVADNFVTNLSSRVREAISNFIGEWIANLEKFGFSQRAYWKLGKRVGTTEERNR